MKANIVDLRYKMKDVLKALNRRERVEIVYRGRAKGVIIPVSEQTQKIVKKHPLFGLLKEDKKSVKKVMDELRGERYVV
ncbi:MAG: type II toxin-antitoxin system prevent-host-death family antitoxin [Candidatus Omnitrophica bacterium]|nr:type II toxin-antitoxin system prevent-host-death family antitoxin [Candidatus Omnitrophota bacterium]